MDNRNTKQKILDTAPEMFSTMKKSIYKVFRFKTKDVNMNKNTTEPVCGRELPGFCKKNHSCCISAAVKYDLNT